LRATLVCCPLSNPTCPPSGIAHIKGFIQENTTHPVTCLDINIQFLRHATDNPLRIAELVGVPGGVAGVVHRLFWRSLLRKKLREIPLIKGAVYRGKYATLDAFIRDSEGIDAAMRCFRNGGEDFKNLARYVEHAGTVSLWHLLLLAQGGPLWQHATKGSRPVEEALSPWLEKIEQTNPDVVGFTIIVADQLEFSLALARSLKKRGIKIVFGGSSIIDFRDKLLVRFPFVDYVLSGPGEFGFMQLLDGRPERDIANLTFRDGGRVQTNDQLPLHDQIRSFACPDYGDFDLDSYLSPERFARILTSRGCYWRRCAFCNHHQSYLNQYFPRDESEVVENLKTLRDKWGIRHVHFVDEMISPKRFARLSRAILGAGLDVDYYAYARPEAGFTHEGLCQMRQSGCRAVLWGVESANRRVLTLMGKGVDIETMSRVLRDSHRAGIKNVLFILFGFPTESESEAYDTLGFLLDHRDCIDGIHMETFYWTPGSPIDRQPEKYGAKVKGRKPRVAPRWFNVRARYFNPATSALLGPDLVDWRPLSGMSQEERVRFLPSHQHIINRVEWLFFWMRDHALIHYSRDKRK
jgi:tRNA A37 methylthiotransferase MiaB